MDSRKEQTVRLLTAHYKTYPRMQLKDMFKFLHQSSFGCEHLLADSMAATEYIRKEADECKTHTGEWTESLDGAFCRVHLDWIKAGLSPETLGKLFFLSAKPVENGKEMLEEKLLVLEALVTEEKLPYKPEEVKEETDRWRKAGYPACHHSEVFRKEYFPAYRVIRKEYAVFLPLFLQIDRMLQKGEVKLAIEGGSAGGKSTLSQLLEQVYGATVFHMDDFFLRPEQRTQERFAQPGGNVDRERFLEEVLLPLNAGETVSYRRFDCSTFTIKEPVMISPGKLNVIEGAYSMHPELSGYYDLSVFLDITPTLQEKRIRKRNLPDMAERFFKEWIPMEQHYFDVMKAKERCDMVILIEDN